MQIPLDQASTLGLVVRATRKAQKIRQDDAAGSIGVSENFLGMVERGGATVQLGKLFQVIEQLGLKVTVEVPESSHAEIMQRLNLLSQKAAQKNPARTEGKS